jgi:hypothetical protein
LRISEIAGGIAQGDPDVRLSPAEERGRSDDSVSRSAGCSSGSKTHSLVGIGQRRSSDDLARSRRTSCARR